MSGRGGSMRWGVNKKVSFFNFFVDFFYLCTILRVGGMRYDARGQGDVQAGWVPTAGRVEVQEPRAD